MNSYLASSLAIALYTGSVFTFAYYFGLRKDHKTKSRFDLDLWYEASVIGYPVGLIVGLIFFFTLNYL